MDRPGRPGLVLAIAQRHRDALLRMERSASSEMVRAYGGIWQRLRGEIEGLLSQHAGTEGADAETSLNWLLQRRRLETLLQQTEREFLRFAPTADQRIQRGQRAAIELSQQSAQAMIMAQAAGLSVEWNRLPTEMVETLVGTMANGSPLRSLLDKLGPDASARVRKGMVEGMALGQNPRDVTRRIRQELGGNLANLLTINRTEMLRAAREATRQSYKENSDIVEGWKWLAAKQGRTCAMCLAMDGTTHDLDEILDDHPNGRCSMVGTVKGAPEVQWQPTGQKWFAQQDEATQRKVLGPPAFQAYQAGAVKLSDFVGQRQSKAWGTTRYAKSLSEILGDDAGQFYARQPKAPTGPTRPVTGQELELTAEIEETKTAYKAALDAGQQNEANAMKGYMESLEQGLQEERGMNEALWNEFEIAPDQATEAQWEQLAVTLDREGRDLYTRYTKEGIELDVMIRRGAKDSGYMGVGGEIVRIKQGRFSRREGQRMRGDLWQQAKESLREMQGDLLERAGFNPSEIAQSNFEQRTRLLQELGQKDVFTTKAGKPSKIDLVSAESRGRVTEAIDHDLAATCGVSGLDPLNMPTLDAYKKMELADRIRSMKLTDVAGEEWVHVDFDDWGL